MYVCACVCFEDIDNDTMDQVLFFKTLLSFFFRHPLDLFPSLLQNASYCEKKIEHQTCYSNNIVFYVPSIFINSIYSNNYKDKCNTKKSISFLHISKFSLFNYTAQLVLLCMQCAKIHCLKYCYFTVVNSSHRHLLNMH